METLDLSQNRFSGSPSFLCTTPYKFFGHIDLSDNQLSGELPDCFINVPNLSVLILTNNNLSGTIPTSITLLNKLQALQLRKNNFKGELPSSLKNCTSLALLDLSENKLSGEVPLWIGTHLTNLVVFSLRNNDFSGTIPAEICLLKNANVLDILIHSIPILSYRPVPLIFFYQRTIYFTNAVVLWKGVASEYRKTLGLLKLIDLSHNRLVGEIPTELASLKELISLNLSRNNLTGTIIQEIGEMKSLEVLDLSKNQLSGKIPGSLASLTSLSVLDLSNNSFSGQIPTGTQLQTFDASAYGGNEQLCGPPLSKCGDILSSPIGQFKKEESNEGDGDRLSKIWLYSTVILGFATGFWGFLCPIMLRKTRGCDYYRLVDKIADYIYVTMTLSMARLQRKISG